MIDFRQADLNSILETYALFRNRTLLRAQALPNPPITLKSMTDLTKREAIEALEAVLGMNGVSTIDFGDKFVKVAPTAAAGAQGGALNTNSVDQMGDMGPFITQIVQLTNVLPSAMVPVLQPYASAGNAGGILSIDGSQVLVLRDFTEHIKRMMEMIKKIDVSVPAEYVSEVIPIKYAKATEIASALNSLSGGGGGGTSTGGGAAPGSSRTAPRGSSGLGGGMRGNLMGNNPNSPLGGSPMSTAGAQPGATAAGAAQSSFASRIQNLVAKASGDIEVIGRTKMISDERSNSLLVFATREDMKMIKEVISKLDVVLAQVLIEAVIMQVTLNNNQDISFSYLQKSGSRAGDFAGIGAINNGSFLNRDSSFNGGTNTLLKSGFSYLANLTGSGDLDVSITAFAANNRAKVLQRPRIQTSHNEPAHLFVGTTQPYPTGSYYGGGSFGGYSQIAQMQIGVGLDITPLINPDGLVVMEISQNLQSVAGDVEIAGVGKVPITKTQEAATKVSVRDRDTIILGGLISTSDTKGNSGVPFLKDIPLLGFFFRSNTEQGDRNELIVFIRPTVLPTPEVAAMAARNERNNMPLIRSYEKDLKEQEEKLVMQPESKTK
jgi:general secretion pathway protein D